MQLITAVVRPFKVSEICDALERFGFRGLTVTEVSGAGKHHDRPEVYRGRSYTMALQHRAKVEILASDLDVRDLLEIVCKVARTGSHGDGKVWVTPVTHAVRIRTGEAGLDAL